MASKILVMNLRVLSLFCTVLPYQAFSTRSLPIDHQHLDTPPAALCAAAVNIHGYECREFQTITDDGYILSVQRIPEGRAGGRGGGGRANRPPVLLQHGVLVDGVSWVANSPEESLAFILADNGFDVWISHIRGTRFSRRHLTLDSATPEYWNWTWDDLVIHDLPSLVQLVYNQTGQKIHYVGHSMGTLIALASFSEGKEIEKVKSAALLSPIAYLSHVSSPLVVVAARAFLGEDLNMFGFSEFNPRGEAAIEFLKLVCSYPGMNCYDLLTAFTGKNCCLNTSTVEFFLKNEPQSTATKNLVHMAQSVRNGKMSKYDYGNVVLNIEHYGEAEAPVYDITKIPAHIPLFLSYGGEDPLSDVRDVEILLDNLKSHDADKVQVEYIDEYGHLDFIMALTAKDILYSKIMAFFTTHNQS